MSSLDGVLTRSFLAKTTGINVLANTPVALRIYNKGKKAVTSVTTVTATSITLIDADGTSGALAFGTYTTLGLLAGKINSLTNWECVILDGLPSDIINTSNVLASAALTSPNATVDGIGFYDVLVDTSVGKMLTVRASMSRLTPSLVSDNYDRRVRINEISYFATLGAAGAAGGSGLFVYEVKGSTETQVMLKASVSATETTNYILNGGSFMDSDQGKDLVVRLADSASVSDTAAHLQVNFRRE